MGNANQQRNSTEIAVTFSPDSSPEHEMEDSMFSGGQGIKGKEASLIGLNEGTFHNVMKLIEESEDEDCLKAPEKETQSGLAIMYDKKENLVTSVEQSQVDGGFDSLSSVSFSPEPSRLSVD